MMDALNDAGSELLELVDKPAAAAISSQMTDDNDKYQTVTDVVQKCADKIKAQRHHAAEVRPFMFCACP